MCAHSPLDLPWLETQRKAIRDRVPVSLGHTCASVPSESSSWLYLLSPGQGGGTTGLPTHPLLPAVETQEPRDWGRPQAGLKRGGHQTGPQGVGQLRGPEPQQWGERGPRARQALGRCWRRAKPPAQASTVQSGAPGSLSWDTPDTVSTLPLGR